MPSKLLRYALAAVVALSVAGCEEEVVKVPPVVTLAVSPDTILNDGEETTTVSITAKDELGQPATGTVVLTAQAGDFAGSENPARTLVTLAEGIGTATYSCSLAKYRGCSEKVTLTAQFGDAVATAVINLTEVPPADLVIEPARETLLAGIGDDSTKVTVTVRREGKPLKTRVSATVDVGEFLGTGKTVTVDTTDAGVAELVYEVKKAEPGTATIKVTAADITAEKKLTLAPPKLGVTFDKPVLYSGAADTVKATFTIQDAAGVPVATQATLGVQTQLGRFVDGTTRAKSLASVQTTAAGTFEATLEFDPSITPAEVGPSKVTGKVFSASNKEIGAGEGSFEVRQAQPALSFADAAKKELYSGVGDSVGLLVKLQDLADTTRTLPRPDVPVTFEIRGTSSARLSDVGGTTTGPKITVPTSATGEVRVVLTAPAAEAQTLKIAATTEGGKESTLDVVIKKVSLALERPSSGVPLTGTVGDSAPITAKLHDNGTALAFAGVDVTFDLGSTPIGELRDAANATLGTRVTLKTDAAGEARLVYLASGVNSATAVTASLAATAASASATLQIPIAPLQVQLDVPSGRTRLFNGLGDKVTLSAQLKGNGSNRSQAGVQLRFTVSGATGHGLQDGGGQLTKVLTATTAADGTASVTFTPWHADLTAKSTVEAVIVSNGVKSNTLSFDVIRPKLALTATPPQLPTGIGSTSTLQADITDENGSPISGLPLAGYPVTFALTSNNTLAGLVNTSGNTVTSLQATTSAAGSATATFTSGTSTGTANLKASAPGMQDGTVAVTLRSVSVQLSFATSNIAYNGIGDSIEIIGQVRRDDGSQGQNVAQAGIPVTFETSEHLFDNGSKIIELTTDSNGRVRAKFTPNVAQLSVKTAKVIAYVTAAGKPTTPPSVDVTVQTVALAISANPTTLNSGSNDTSTITVEMKDGTNPVPRAGVTLQLSTNNGMLTAGSTTAKTVSVTTDAGGKATASFSPAGDAVSTSASIVASRSPLNSPSVNITLVPTTVTLSGNGTKLYRNVGDSLQFTAQLRQNGQDLAKAGESVTFTASSHAFSNGQATFTTTTDSNGRAAVTLQTSLSDAAGTVDVVVSYLGIASNKLTVAVVTPSITLIANPNRLTTGIGQTSLVTAQLRDGTSDLTRAGVGITFDTSLGQFTGGATTCTVGVNCITVSTDAGGKATATLETGSAVQGTATLNASRASLTAGQTTVQFQPVTLAVETAKSTLFTGVNDSTTGTVTVTAGGSPLTNKTIALTTSLGTLSNLSLTTDSNGKAYFTLQAGSADGVATLTATYATGTGTASVGIKRIDEVKFVGTIPVMGVQGSGLFENVTIQFRASSGVNPVGAGIGMSFSLTSQSGAKFSNGQATASGVTDSSGLVTLSVNSGTLAEIVTVAATSGGAATSVDIPVRWNRPSAKGMTLACDKLNLDVFNTAQPPKAINVGCKVKLLERDGSVLRVDTPIKFLSEGGALPPEVVMVGTTTGTGEVSFSFSTQGDLPQAPTGGPLKFRAAVVDTTVTPTITIFPTRMAEPVSGSGNYPRGRYVNMVAWAIGEEEFADSNSNGRWDAGELFTDVARTNGRYDPAEPFVDGNGNGIRDSNENFLDTNGNGQWDSGESFTDANANGVYDAGETFVDTSRVNGVWDTGEAFTDANGNTAYDGPELLVDLGEPFADLNDNGWWDNGEPFQDVDADSQWTPPNGKWDRRTGIWVPLWFVYTGHPAVSFSPSSISVGQGTSVIVTMMFGDSYLNPLATSSSYAVTRTGNRGTFTINWGDAVNGTATAATGKDGFGGGGVKLRKVGMRLGGACETNKEPVCIWRTYLDSWPDGFLGTMTVNGAPSGTTGAAENQTYTLSATVNGNNVTSTAAVLMQ